MSQVLANSEIDPNRSASLKLRGEFTAMKLSFKWFGVRRSLTDQQKQLAAESFGAEGTFLSAGKKLIDTSHPAFRVVSQIRSQAVALFRTRSLPFPEPGLRLIRHADVDDLNAKMGAYRSELQSAVQSLQDCFSELKRAAQDRLGSLYVESDYPDRLVDLFDMHWEFPSVEPPNYLMALSPEIYRQECDRVREQFDDAVRMAEQAFLEELGGLISHLSERLSGDQDGKPKIFRDSVVENITEFLDRFQRLTIHSSPQLEELVARAGRVIRGVQPENLRADASLRQRTATQLSGIQSVLDGLMIDRPRRRIIRGTSQQEGTHHEG